MTVTKVDKNFATLYRAETTSFLLGNLIDYVIMTLNISVKSHTQATASDYFSFVDGGNTITRSNIQKSFIDDGYSIGDSIYIHGADAGNCGTYTITNVTDTIITTSTTFGTTEDSTTANITGQDAITAIDFYSNLIENSEPNNYYSKVDANRVRRYSKGGLNAADTSTVNYLEFQGQSKAGNYSVVTAKGKGIVGSGSDYSNNFELKEYFTINPFCLVDQIDGVENGLPAPDYFEAEKCLKHICQVDCLPNKLDPNRKQSGTFTEQGNTGWIDESFNRNDPKFHVTDIEYQDYLTCDYIDSLQHCRDTRIKITLHSDDSVFCDYNTDFYLSHNYMPNDITQYQDTTTNMLQNFIFDAAANTIGNSAVNGGYYGTSYQVLTDVYGVFCDYSNCEIYATVKFASALKTRIGALDSENLKYMLAVGVQDHTKTPLTSDRVTVKCDVNEYMCDLTDTSTFDLDRFSFYDHPWGGCDYFVSDYEIPINRMTIENGLIFKSIFHVDITETPLINDLTIKIDVRDITAPTVSLFSLEDRTFDMSQFVINNNVQEINVDIEREFILKDEDDFKWIKIFRRSDLDNGNLVYYEINYAFKIRWEDWLELQEALGSFYPNQNNDWDNYKTGNYSPYFNVIVNMEKDDFVTEIEHSESFEIQDYDEFIASDYAMYDNWNIRTYDPDTLINTNGGILKNKNTLVIASWVLKNYGDIVPFYYLPQNLVGCLRLEEYRQGGINGIEECSTIYERPEISKWIGYTTDDKSEITLNTYTIRLKAYINYETLNPLTDAYKISAFVCNKDLYKIKLGDIILITVNNYAFSYNFNHVQKLNALIIDPVKPIEIGNIIPLVPDADCRDNELCDFCLTVFADLQNPTDEYHNDQNSFLYGYSSINDTAEFTLQSNNGTSWSDEALICDYSLGQYYPLNYFPGYRTYSGFVIHWYDVMNAYGEGLYRFKINSEISGVSSTCYTYAFCLKQWNCNDQTVRFETRLNHKIGSIDNDMLVLDFGTLNWYNQLRIEGIFGYEKSEYERETVQYTNGQIDNVLDVQKPIYELLTGLLPHWLHKTIKTYILQADDIQITDYNSHNPDYQYFRKKVKCRSSYEPMYHKPSRVARVRIEFENKINNLEKKHC